MLNLPDNPWDAPNLCAMFIAAWKRQGEAVALDDGEDAVTYNVLARRVMALSCFVDEIAGERRGPVLLFMPTGRRVVGACFGVLATGRAAFPVDAMLRASAPVPGGESSAPPVAFPSLDELPEPPSLILTLRSLERLLHEAVKDSRLRDLPILFYDEIANQMDARHQEIIRARLEDPWLAGLLGLAAGERALWLPANGGGPPVSLSHGFLMKAVKRQAAASGHPPRPKFLAMTRLDRLSTWAAAYLPAVALGGTMSFIRRFYPAHVLSALREEGVRVLLMTPEQYGELMPLVERSGLGGDFQFWCDPPPAAPLARMWRERTGRQLNAFEGRS